MPLVPQCMHSSRLLVPRTAAAATASSTAAGAANAGAARCAATPATPAHTRPPIHTHSHTLARTHNAAVMLRELDASGLAEAPRQGWIGDFAADCRRRVVSLYAHEFRGFDTATALTLIDAGTVKQTAVAAAAAGEGGGGKAATEASIAAGE
jgi:hypothetical protein